MGEFSDYLEKNNLGGDLSAAVGTAETIAGTVSGAYGYYGAAKDLGATLGLWESEADGFDRLADMIEQIQKTIVAGFKVVLEQLQREGQQAKLDALVDLDDARLGALVTLRTYGQQGLSQHQLEDLQFQSHVAGYMESSVWNLVYYPHMNYSDPWSGQIVPSTDGVSLPAFAILLPRYLRAIAIRITCLAVIFPDPFRGNARDEILEHAERLRQVHDTIASAMTPLRRPTLAEMTPWPRPPFGAHPGSLWDVRPSKWAQGKRMHGAVEPFTSLAVVREFPDPEPKPPAPADYPVPGERLPEHVPPPNRNAPGYQPPDTSGYKIAFDQWVETELKPYYAKFVVRHAARTWSARKRLYIAAGLAGTWNTMNTLRRMAGADPVAAKDRVFDDAWSMRELRGVVVDTVGPFMPKPSSLRGLGAMLGYPPPRRRGAPQVFSMRGLCLAPPNPF